MNRRLRPFGCMLVTCFIALSASAQPGPAPQARAARAFDLASRNPLSLHAFLAAMPKGADLHLHLSGAIYAESLIADAAADSLCINPATLSLVKAEAHSPACPNGDLPAATALTDQKLYDELIDSFSMRGFVPSTGETGHDHFFATFTHAAAIDKRHAGEWLDQVARLAASDNEQYLEVMETPAFATAARLGYEAGWPGSAAPGNDSSEATPHALSTLRDKLLASGLRAQVEEDAHQLDRALAQRRQLEHCDQPDAAPACAVKIRFLAQVLRASPPQQVFAQTLLYFELAEADPNVVGINFVQPEDAFVSMREYHRQMLMLDFLHAIYPHVHIALHAGELAPGLVPPAGLSFHIREAVELGHADRIGHGVDIMYEREPAALLKEMADRHIMTEINLTSNDLILGISGEHHPFPLYLAAHVPVALSTDDEGVSRIDLTHEYVRAVTDFHLTYLDLKQMARTSLEHAFLPGPSLWLRPDDFSRTVTACAHDKLGSEAPTQSCLLFLRSSDRASEQWELEHRYRIFESLQH